MELSTFQAIAGLIAAVLAGAAPAWRQARGTQRVAVQVGEDNEAAHAAIFESLALVCRELRELSAVMEAHIAVTGHEGAVARIRDLEAQLAELVINHESGNDEPPDS